MAAATKIYSTHTHPQTHTKTLGVIVYEILSSLGSQAKKKNKSESTALLG